MGEVSKNKLPTRLSDSKEGGREGVGGSVSPWLDATWKGSLRSIDRKGWAIEILAPRVSPLNRSGKSNTLVSLSEDCQSVTAVPGTQCSGPPIAWQGMERHLERWHSSFPPHFHWFEKTLICVFSFFPPLTPPPHPWRKVRFYLHSHRFTLSNRQMGCRNHVVWSHDSRMVGKKTLKIWWRTQQPNPRTQDSESKQSL